MDPPRVCGVTMASSLGDTSGDIHGPSTLSYFQQTPTLRSKGWILSRCSRSWHKWLCTCRNLWCCHWAPSTSPGP